MFNFEQFKAHRFRASPHYELVAYNALSFSQQEELKHLLGDADFFGLLIPRSQNVVSVKTVSGGNAFLLLALREPTVIPEYFLRAYPDFVSHLHSLLLDKIVEVEYNGQFCSGPAFEETEHRYDPASVSDKALLYAARLPIYDPLILSGRLYFFNRLPTSVHSCYRLNNQAAVKQLLGVENDPSLDPSIQFREVTSNTDNKCFMSWSRVGISRSASAAFKLYICPYPDDLPFIFRRCVTIAGQHGAFSIKVACDRPTLNRPDKFVAYFASLREMRACIPDLTSALEGLPVHELPFSARLSTAALYWGRDPNETEQGPAWNSGESWRIFVTRKLAAALLLARQNGCDPHMAVAFSKHRASLEGIDVKSWAPAGVQL